MPALPCRGARPGKRSIVAAVVTLLGALALVALGAAPAHAHDQLVASSPIDGEHLDAAPTEVRLSFNGEPLELGTTVMVTKADDPSTDLAQATVLDGRDVVAELPDLPDGHYDVRWRVVSSDGHPISGVIPFSVGDAGQRLTTTPETAPIPEPDDPVAESSDAPTGLPAPARTVLVAVGGAGAGLLVLWLIGRVRRRPR